MILDLTMERMIIFFVIFAVGFAVGKLHIIRADYMPSLAQLITKVFLPVLIFYSTYANCTRQTIIDNWKMVLLAVVFHASICLLMLLIAKGMRIERDKDRVFQLCFIFGNTGFVGIPLLTAVFPNAGLVYMMMFTIVDQAVFWTYGIWLSTARGSEVAKFTPRSLLTPNTVAIVLALAFVMFEIPLPSILTVSLGTISSATSALCMIYLGALACFSKVAHVLKRPELYVGIIVKMIALPALAGRQLDAVGIFPHDMVAALVIIMALPVMTVVPMVVASNGKESDYATGITVATLVVSVVTIPLTVFLAGC